MYFSSVVEVIYGHPAPQVYQSKLTTRHSGRTCCDKPRGGELLLRSDRFYHTLHRRDNSNEWLCNRSRGTRELGAVFGKRKQISVQWGQTTRVGICFRERGTHRQRQRRSETLWNIALFYIQRLLFVRFFFLINPLTTPSVSPYIEDSRPWTAKLLLLIIRNCTFLLLLPQKTVQDFYFERGGRVMVSALSLGNSLRA